MPFKIDERQDEGAITWIGEWPFAARSYFIRSNGYDTFIRELRRYVRGEVPGRSFLVAGHRGTGKTTLVRHAIEELTRNITQESIDQTQRAHQTPFADRVLDQQRPLMVRLYGPSLLDTKPADEGANGQAASVDDPTTVALQQITIALYRALAVEFSRSFANHARDQIYQAEQRKDGRGRVADYLELAAQFTLDLDDIPRAARLRDYYRRLGRFEAGVLWPGTVGAALLQVGLNDRGVREIVALTTAAQAFEVCVGKVDDKKTSNASGQAESSVESKGEATIGDVVNKLLGLAAGVGVGVGAGLSGSDPIVGALLGIATAALTTLTFSWSSKRSTKKSETSDYTFIRERNKQSLERDLPQVIQRVRDAGLAPVFVLDELDKLQNAPEQIAALISRLKHLVTDLGCFCFLTDRDYYQQIFRKVQAGAFPPEHTFFSHMLLVLPHPDQFLEYLRNVIRPDSGSASPAVDETARSIFGYFVLHRAKMNMAEVMRNLAMSCFADGRLRPSETELRNPEYMLAASIQLAIGVVLRQGEMQQRVAAEPRFMQLAIDALYMLSRAWEQQELTVELDRNSIVCCLLQRSGEKVPDGPPAGAEQALLGLGLGLNDLNIIVRHAELLASLLCDSAKLRAELRKAGQLDLADLIPYYNLIEPVDDADRTFEFLYDVYGNEIDSGPAEQLQDRVDAQVDALRELELVLGDLGLDAAALGALQILPPNIAAAELGAARDRLGQPLAGAASPDYSKDLTLSESVTAFLAQSGGQLAALVRLALQVAADARNSIQADIAVRPGLEAIGRYMDYRGFLQGDGGPGALFSRLLGVSPDVVLSSAAPNADAASIRAWRADIAARRQVLMQTTPRFSQSLADAAWARWQDRILAFVRDGISVIDPASYDDIVSCAAQAGPGPVFRRDVKAMNWLEWSELCLSGHPDIATAPPWTFAAGLRLLGFGVRTIEMVASLPTQMDGSIVRELAAGAPMTEVPGYVLVALDEDSVGSNPISSVDRPVLVLPRSKLDTYIVAIDWLISNGAVSAVFDEERARQSNG